MPAPGPADLVEGLLDQFLHDLGIDYARFIKVVVSHEGSGQIHEDVFAAVT